MRVAFLAVAIYLPCLQAYESAGWAPGKPITKYLTSTVPNAIPTGAPSPAAPKKPWSVKDLKFNLEDVLTSEPVGKFLSRFGFNITAQLELAREGIPPRFATEIPLITDENYETVLNGEEFTSDKEEMERVWAVMVSIGAQDPVSTFFDKTFDGAHNLTVEAGDLRNVKWGRVDYIAVTEITTRWAIWKAPVLVISKDNGKTLRFFKTSALKRMREPEQMRQFLLQEEWAESAPWSGPWSPNGNRAPYLAKFAKFSALVYGYLSIMPRWLLLLITGTIASTAMQFLHSGGAPGPTPAEAASLDEKPDPVPVPVLEVEPAATKVTGAKSSASTPKKRKGKK